MIEKKVTPFSDFPIQFKQINHSDFDGYNFEDGEKTIIQPDEKGFISDELNNLIDLSKSNTTVINASVGQGKTTAIINFIKYYFQQNKYHNGNYKVVIVTPFKTLNKEYISKIKDQSGLDICFDYQKLEEPGINNKKYSEFYKKTIQLISIKSILGDPGTVALRQSKIKREYYKYLIQTSQKQGCKIIFIFDEIHESLDSFKRELLPNLFKWNHIIHKIIIASATFSESSIVAIKFLSELTGRKLRILESKRIQRKEQLSDLHICLYNQYNLKEDDEYLYELFKTGIENSSTANILCYSKNTAKIIFDSKIGKLLEDKFGSVNLNTADSKKPFDHQKCNIGTRFKTGISIEKENSSYFIILPLKFSYSNENKKTYGIFSDRMNSLIQGIARPRNKSKIFIITPQPENIISNPKIDKKLYINQLSIGYLKLNEEKFQREYQSLDIQDNILNEFYEENKIPITKEINKVENLELDMGTQFPTYDFYKLTKGDDHLYSNYDSYGKYLRDYVYWAAWNNQFVNCKLRSIIKVSTYFFTEGKVQKQLDKYFNETFFTDSFFTFNSSQTCYYKIRNTLFSNDLFYQKKEESDFKQIGPYKNLNFEQQIITFIQRKKVSFNFEFRKKIYPPDGSFFENIKSSILKPPKDYTFDKESLIRIHISHSIKLSNFNIEKYNVGVGNIILAYKRLYNFKKIIIDDYSSKDQKGGLIIPTDNQIRFTKSNKFEFKTIMTDLITQDDTLKCYDLRINSFKKDSAIYKFLKNLFFNTSRVNRVIEGKQRKVLIIKKEYDYSNVENYINLIYDTETPWLDQVPPLIL